MCSNIELKNLSTGGHKAEKQMVEWIRKKPDEPSYYEKMVYFKNNYKRLTKGCKVISANWPSFDVYELPVIWKQNNV